MNTEQAGGSLEERRADLERAFLQIEASGSHVFVRGDMMRLEGPGDGELAWEVAQGAFDKIAPHLAEGIPEEEAEMFSFLGFDLHLAGYDVESGTWSLEPVDRRANLPDELPREYSRFIQGETQERSDSDRPGKEPLSLFLLKALYRAFYGGAGMVGAGVVGAVLTAAAPYWVVEASLLFVALAAFGFLFHLAYWNEGGTS